MYITETTGAILIAFLAFFAWSEIQSRLAKGCTRSKDPEAPDSPRRLSFRGWKFQTAAKSPEVVATQGKPLTDSLTLELSSVAGLSKLATYKQFYNKLHNLERYPEVLPECRELLLSFLSSTLGDALRDPNSGILSVEEFSRQGLVTS